MRSFRTEHIWMLFLYSSWVSGNLNRRNKSSWLSIDMNSLVNWKTYNFVSTTLETVKSKNDEEKKIICIYMYIYICSYSFVSPAYPFNIFGILLLYIQTTDIFMKKNVELPCLYIALLQSDWCSLVKLLLLIIRPSRNKYLSHLAFHCPLKTQRDIQVEYVYYILCI